MQSTRITGTQTQGVAHLFLWLAGAVALAAATPEYRLEVVHVYPHDRTAFTQGLEYHDGLLYEGTGIEGRSRLRVEHLETGKVIREVPLDPKLFGEGITVLGHYAYQLTWLGGRGFVYDAATFRRLRQFSYPGQGWGLTNDGFGALYMSDGTAEIRVWDVPSLKELRRITIHDGDRRIDMLNELEWVRGELWANVWQTDRIVRISPVDGRVLGWIDATGLLQPGEVTNPDAVLNGIAYDERHDRLFVTGKLWPKIFEVRVVPAGR
jgi:glutaminyl-peptide cyclotransferase